MPLTSMIGTDAITITRGRGGEVEADGPLDECAVRLLLRAGFLAEGTLSGYWYRLPFDLGGAWENQTASHAAQMLTAARYRVVLDPALRPAQPTAGTPSLPQGRATNQPPPLKAVATPLPETETP
ncbi:hypothetical protein ABZW18_34600 [Streptomyces sp. NPDC004647]|uniref:hypothetical protein n=1 Tax=Streptomyces sp. NPDC004647 TaxID=3154671 RepID=UPI0033AC2BB7